MKFPSSKISVVLASSMFAVAAFAAGDAHKGSLELGRTAAINGKEIHPGSYQVRWEGSGPNVALDILQNGKVIVTTPAQVVDLNEKSSDDVAELHSNPDGKQSLSEIRFSGKKYALTIGVETAQTQAEAKTATANK